LAADLSGLRIALTRPVGQGDALAARIRAAGGEVLALPLLEIALPTQPVEQQVFHAQIARADVVIFISPNAVRMALRCLPVCEWLVGGGCRSELAREASLSRTSSLLQKPSMPPAPVLAALGQGTARVLHEAGFSQVLAPSEGADSEALLALSELQQLAGQHILLVRGEGGRELLAKTLGERGALVEHAVVYRRLTLPPDMATLRARSACIFVLTSSEALRVLLGAAHDDEDMAWLCAQDFVFAHPRIAAQAKTYGLNRGIMAASPDDAAVFAALLQFAHPKEIPHDGQNDAFIRKLFASRSRD
jgi:uroporphyrinogen-III synthase